MYVGMFTRYLIGYNISFAIHMGLKIGNGSKYSRVLKLACLARC